MTSQAIVRVVPPLAKAKFRRHPVVISVIGEITEELAADFADLMADAQESGQPIVPVLIHSEGGDVYSMCAMATAIASSCVPVATIVTGIAASSAACLFTCGHPAHRYMAPDARLMLHNVSVDLTGSIHAAGIQAEAHETQRMNQRILEMMAQNCGKGKRFFARMLRRHGNADVYIDGNEALTLGISSSTEIPRLVAVVQTEMRLETPCGRVLCASSFSCGTSSSSAPSTCLQRRPGRKASAVAGSGSAPVKRARVASLAPLPPQRGPASRSRMDIPPSGASMHDANACQSSDGGEGASGGGGGRAVQASRATAPYRQRRHKRQQPKQPPSPPEPSIQPPPPPPPSASRRRAAAAEALPVSPPDGQGTRRLALAGTPHHEGCDDEDDDDDDDDDEGALGALAPSCASDPTAHPTLLAQLHAHQRSVSSATQPETGTADEEESAHGPHSHTDMLDARLGAFATVASGSKHGGCDDGADDCGQQHGVSDDDEPL